MGLLVAVRGVSSNKGEDRCHHSEVSVIHTPS